MIGHARLQALCSARPRRARRARATSAATHRALYTTRATLHACTMPRLLAAALCAAATAAPTPPTVSAPLDALRHSASASAVRSAPLGNYSAGCAADHATLKADVMVHDAHTPVLSISTVTSLKLLKSCASNASKCTTPLGAGECCAADGAAGWVPYQDVVDTYNATCQVDVAGHIFWLVEQTVVDDGKSLLQSTYTHTQPFFIPARCHGVADVSVLLESLSHSCAYNPFKGKVRSCRFDLASSVAPNVGQGSE